jgi:hypothetical protein
VPLVPEEAVAGRVKRMLDSGLNASWTRSPAGLPLPDKIYLPRKLKGED